MLVGSVTHTSACGQAPQESRTLLGGPGQGMYIRYLTKPKAYGQIAMRLLFGQRKNRFVKEE